MYKTALLISAAIVGATSANATTTVYTSQAAFLAALGGTTTTETFSSTTLVPGLTYSSKYGHIASGVFNDDVVRGSATTTFHFAPAIKGFAATFDETPDGFGQGIAFYINGTKFVSELDEANAGTFYGFVFDVAFTSVLITAGTGPLAGEHYTLDNLKFGAGTSTVPEPASWAMMLTGLGLVGYALRKRTQRTTITYS